jgi:hypothetical protein
MARVYVSSTFMDLEAHRKQVSLALRRLRHEDVAMEYYVAEEKRPIDRCLGDVDSCDAYVGMFAWRYGFVPTQDNPEHLAITHQEFRRAYSAGKPCFIFLLDGAAPWPVELIDEDRTAIKALRAEVSGEDRGINYFKSEDELARKVTEALSIWTSRSGLGESRSRSDFAAYRASVVERHQWVRLQVIAGVSKERGPIRVPLTEVFEPQLVSRGASGTKLASEIRRYQEQIYGHRLVADSNQADDQADDGADDQADDALPSGDDAFFPFPAQEETEAEEQDQPLSTTEQVFDVLGQERTQVILGGPGSGKSTLLQFVMLKAAQLGDDDLAGTSRYLSPEATPFLIELRKYTLSKDPDFITHIINQSRELYGADLAPGDVAELLGRPDGALVFFDGLDEIFDPDDRRRVVDQFQTFARSYQNATIVVTSRIAGYDPESLALANFEHYTLMPLTIAHIRNFAEHWYRYYSLEGTEHTAQGLVQRMLDSPRLLDLAGNPLLLTMMAVIYKDRDLPVERWQLYERCAVILLEDWEILKGIEDEDAKLAVPIKTAQKSEILQLVSENMLQGRETGAELNAIGYQSLLEIVAGYLGQKYQRSAGEAEAIAVDILRHLMERTYVLAGIGERAFGFVHRTFMEYFAACRCQAQFNARRSDFTWLNDQIFGAHWNEPEWEEVLLLLIAMLHDQGTPIRDVIERLRSSGNGLPFPYHTAFAARCLGESGTVQDQAQGESVLDELAEAIAEHAPKSKNADAQAFVEQALASFASLASEVTAGARTRAAIERLEVAGSVTERTAAWQMSFALLPRKARLAFALEALDDREEVVRRGAIAVLEREWPGRREIGAALSAVVQRDRQARVRLAALVAIQRAWRDEPSVLDAIASRLPRETAFTVVVRMIDYLGSAWPKNDRALELVLNLIAHQPRNAGNYSYPDVSVAGSEAIRRGWGHDAAALTSLKSRVNDESRPVIRTGYVMAMARGWAGDSDAFEFVRRHATTDEDPMTRRGLVQAIGRGWGGQPDALSFLQAIAVAPEDAADRLNSLDAIATGWSGDRNVLDFLQERSSAEADPALRRDILSLIARSWAPDRDALAYLQQRAADDAPTRSAALDAIAQGWAYDIDVLASLQHHATKEPDPTVRSDYLLAMTKGWFNTDASDFLERRFLQDPDSAPRAQAYRGLLLRLLSRPVWEDAKALIELVDLAGTGLRHEDAAIRAVGVEYSPYITQYASFSPVRDHVAAFADLVDLLCEIARDERDTGLRLNALNALAVAYRLGVTSRRAGGGGHEVFELVKSSRSFVEDAVVSHSDPSTRCIALWILSDIARDQQVRSLLKSRASVDPDPSVRAEALRAFAWNQRGAGNFAVFLRERAEADPENAPVVDELLPGVADRRPGRRYMSHMWPLG